MSYLHKFIDCTKMIQTVAHAKVNVEDNIYDVIIFSCFSIHSRSQFFTIQIMFHFYNKFRRITYGNLEIFKLKVSTLVQFTILVRSDRSIRKKSRSISSQIYIFTNCVNRGVGTLTKFDFNHGASHAIERGHRRSTSPAIVAVDDRHERSVQNSFPVERFREMIYYAVERAQRVERNRTERDLR